MADEACGVALGEQHNWRQAQAMPSLPLGATIFPLILQTTEPSYCRREKRVYQGPRKGSDLSQGARAEETPTQRPHTLSNSAKQYLRLYSRDYSSFRRFLLPPLLCRLMNEPLEAQRGRALLQGHTALCPETNGARHLILPPHLTPPFPPPAPPPQNPPRSSEPRRKANE